MEPPSEEVPSVFPVPVDRYSYSDDGKFAERDVLPRTRRVSWFSMLAKLLPPLPLPLPLLPVLQRDGCLVIFPFPFILG